VWTRRDLARRTFPGRKNFDAGPPHVNNQHFETATGHSPIAVPAVLRHFRLHTSDMSKLTLSREQHMLLDV